LLFTPFAVAFLLPLQEQPLSEDRGSAGRGAKALALFYLSKNRKALEKEKQKTKQKQKIKGLFIFT
jgi:hypothetical protein